MNPLDILFGQVAKTIRDHSSPDTPGPSYDSNPLLGALAGLFGQHAQQSGGQFGGYDPNADYSNARPASEDPYGDPADQGVPANVRPASEDPYGDPADQGGGFANVRPASEDPYGDPADQR